MKIAILFYGRINNCKEYYENTKENLIDNNNADVYLSCDNGSENDLNDFIKLYNPIKFCNDKIIYDFSEYDKYSTHGKMISASTLIPSLINKKRVFELMKSTNNIYDIIISQRVDITYFNKFNIYDIISNDLSSLYIPSQYDHTGINDHISIGNFNNMEKYMNIFNNIILLMENGASKHSETLTLANINYYNINVIRFDLTYFMKKYFK